MSKIKSTWSVIIKKYNIYLVLVILFFLCALINPNFMSVGNLTNISKQLAVTTILAFGATMLIIGGMLDLSAGSVLALAGVIAVDAFKQTDSLVLSLLVGILVGMACNLINAVMVANFKVPPFIATLAMMMAARGMALFYTQGQNILQLGRFTVFGQDAFYGVPVSVIFLIVIAIFTWYILRHTRFGRALYAVGGNEEAAVASGINEKRVKYTAYLINGALVGIAGVLFMSRINAGQPNGAVGFEFHALTASILGGTSFSGGIGTASGTLAGSFIVGFLNNIMNLANVNSYLQQIIRGAIIALAVIYDIWIKGRRTKSRLGSIDKSSSSVDGENPAKKEEV